MRISVGDVLITDRQKELVNQALDNNRLSYGELTREFEEKWAELHQVAYALFCNSGTSALQVALHALKKEGNWSNKAEVIIPAQTFVATMNVVLQNNLKPVFVDVREDTFNINPELIKKAITSNTVAIMPVHLLGQPAEMDKIMDIANSHSLAVVEDSCEAVGATYNGQSVGSFGDFGCFSTYSAHTIITGVGGFVCTNDPDLAVMVKGLYNHGRDGVYHSIDSDDKDPIKMVGHRFNFVHVGYSYRATELESAIGLGHLERLEEEIGTRISNWNYLYSRLQEITHGKGYFYLQGKSSEKIKQVPMVFPVVCEESVDREDLIEFLEENQIETRPMMPLINQPVVKDIFGDIEDKYPVAKMLNQKAFHIGVHAQLTPKHLDYVISKFYEYFKR